MSSNIDIATEIKELKKWKVRSFVRSSIAPSCRARCTIALGNEVEYPVAELATRRGGHASVESTVVRRSARTPHPLSSLRNPQAVTFLAIPVCAVKAFVDLSLEHEHGEDAPGYPYLRIRSKEFPWGDVGLFETEH